MTGNEGSDPDRDHNTAIIRSLISLEKGQEALSSDVSEIKKVVTANTSKINELREWAHAHDAVVKAVKWFTMATTPVVLFVWGWFKIKKDGQ